MTFEVSFLYPVYENAWDRQTKVGMETGFAGIGPGMTPLHSKFGGDWIQYMGVIGQNVTTIRCSLKIWRVMVLEWAWLLNESWDSDSLFRDA